MGVVTRPVEWLGSAVGKYPFSAAGALAALVGGAVTFAAVAAVGGGATLADLLAFVTAHPAYPAAAVIGVLVLLFFEG